MIRLRVGRFRWFDIERPSPLELAGLGMVLIFLVILVVFGFRL
jgi:hypothetical protein